MPKPKKTGTLRRIETPNGKQIQHQLTNEAGQNFIVGEAIAFLWSNCDGQKTITEVIAETANILDLSQRQRIELAENAPAIMQRLDEGGLLKLI